MTTKTSLVKYRFIAGLLLFSSLFLFACGSGSIVQDKFTVPNSEWKFDQVFTSQMPVKDTINPYNFYLNIRNGGDYPYSNLHIFVTTTFPNGKKAIDTVNCELADKNGRWLGKGLGDILDNRIMFRYHRIFPMSGLYQISLRHAMRDSIVPAILNLGISVEKAN